jgi:iron complex outermembrane receptor protein
MSFEIRSPDRSAAASWFKAALSAGCALAAMTVSGAALAQEQAAAGASEASGVEEIVVTAQRRIERLENVPMSVTALSSAALDRANVVNVHELSRVTPGVQFNFAGVSTQPAIRGVTSLTNGTGNENNVAIYVDGFYVSDNISINQDLANIQSVQVLKGPQGTLYGRNATGGAILIQTLDPTRELSGKFEGSYGRFSEKKLSGYISGPLSEKVGFIVSGAFRDSDGWLGLTDPTNTSRTNGHANPIKQRSFRAKLKAELTDTIKATLAYNYGFSSDTTGQLFSTYQYVPSTLLATSRPCCFGDEAYNYKPIASAKSNEATLKLEWETPIGKLTSYSSYGTRKIRDDFDFDGSYQDLTFSSGRSRFKTIQENVDYVINAIKNVDLVVGGNYFNDKFHADAPITFNPGHVLANVNYRNLKTDAYALYADATYHVTDKLTLGVGGRYSHDRKYQDQQTFSASGAVLQPFISSSKPFKKFTVRATARYEVAEHANVYASFSQGFRAGSFNASATTNAAAALPIKNETINAYEIGFKTAQRWYRAEISGFYYDYKNLNTSLTVPNPLNPAAPTTIIGNAPKAKIRGIDASVTVTPVERLNINVGAEYLHARYGSFTNAVGTGLNVATGLNAASQVQDWTGKQMSRAPNFTANIGGDYTVPLAEGELRLSGNVKYSDSYVVNNPSLYDVNPVQCNCAQVPANLLGKQRYRNPKTTLIDGEITWFGPDERYWVGVYGKNLTNKSYRLTYNGLTFGDYSVKAPPISYGVKVGYKF